jgi:hypothetical protein
MNKNYAIIKNNIIENIIIIDINIMLIEELKSLYEADEIIELNLEDSDNISHCVIGASYVDSKFKRPKPYPSWVFDEILNDWNSPIPFPGSQSTEDEQTLITPEWDEETLSWVIV